MAVSDVVALRREDRLAAEAVVGGDDEEPGVDDALEEPALPLAGLPRRAAAMADPPAAAVDVDHGRDRRVRRLARRSVDVELEGAEPFPLGVDDRSIDLHAEEV